MTDQISEGATRTVTALFDDEADATAAVNSLQQNGIAETSIRLVNGGAQQADQATHKGFFDALADFFMPSEDRRTYAEGLRRGGYLVTVSALDDAQHDVAVDILDREGAVNLDEKEEAWRSEGWASGTDQDDEALQSTRANASLLTNETIQTADLSPTGSDEVIPIVDEQLQVGKRDVNLGRVRVRSYVVEQPVSEQVRLQQERVSVDRHAVDRPVQAGDAAFTERTIQAEEHAEEPVVSKQARVTEEIALRKEGTEREETVSDSVRHTEVEVEDERGTAGSTSTGTSKQ